MVLVTGATGILGSTLLLHLLESGYTVRAAKRPSSNIKQVLDTFEYYTKRASEFYEKIEWVDIDFDDLDSLRVALEGVDVVYHCAAKVSFFPKDKKEMYHTNILGTRNLLYIAEEKKVKKILFVSSIAVLDGTNEHGFLDENSNFNSKLDHSAYAVSKHFSEMEVWRASAEGMPVIVLNPGVIIGSGNWHSSSGVLFETMAKLPYISGGSTAYVDVRDVAKIALQLMNTSDYDNERFIIISENKSYEMVSNWVRAQLGLSSTKELSNLWISFLGILNFLFGWLYPPFRYFNKSNREALTTNIPFSNEKIVKALDYKFIPIKDSLEFHIKNWIKSTRRSS